MWQKYFSFFTLSAVAVRQVSTWLIWALVAYSALSWGLQIWGQSSQLTSAASTAVAPTAIDEPALAKALGAQATAAATPAPQASERFKLMGVVADQGGSGVALIALDGQSAKPYRVGQTLTDGWIIQSISPRRVWLAPQINAEPTLALNLPALDLTAAKTSDKPDSESLPRKGNPAP